METELWLRNPLYTAQAAQVAGITNMVWDRGLLYNKGIDPQQHGKSLFPTREFRTISVGHGRQWEGAGAVEMTHERSWQYPAAIYPVWRYGVDDLKKLKQFLDYGAFALPPQVEHKWFKPGGNQEHRVFIADLPNARHAITKSTLATLSEYQIDYPDCKIHLYDTNAFQWICGGVFAAADYNPSYEVMKQYRAILPTGKRIRRSEGQKHGKWLHMLGYKTEDLDSMQHRLEISVLSYLWAAKNWNADGDVVPSSKFQPMQIDSYRDIVNGGFPHRTTMKRATNKNAKLQPGDYILCESCSLADRCRSFRVGSVCSVSGSEAKNLRSHFETRNSDIIVAGLAKLMGTQIDRFNEGRDLERLEGELDPHVTKMGDALFKQGVQLAKLVDPSLRGSALVQINNSNGVQVGASSNGAGESTHAIASRVISELESGGVPRNNIDEAMVRRAMEAPNMDEFILQEVSKYQLPEAIEVGEAF